MLWPQILRQPRLPRIQQLLLLPARGLYSTMTVRDYKLKGITSLSSLQKGQKQAYQLEDLSDKISVLLVNYNGKVHALSPKCTHYGAPLVKGVLSDDRLVCPWHGACFNVTTGDVEDAPALDPLAKYEISEREDGIYINGDPEVVENNRLETLSVNCKAVGQEQVVIVGGGSGCLGVVEGLRQSGCHIPITVISQEGYRPIDRTKLSKALATDVDKLAFRSEDFYKNAAVKLEQGEVTAVDFAAKTVTTAAGKIYPYTKLVLATGGKPSGLSLPGFKEGELGNIFVLRTVPHAKAIVDALGNSPKRVVVVGSSFIGMEVANKIATMELGDDKKQRHKVSVVGRKGAVPLERVMGKALGHIFRALLEKSGVEFYMNSNVESASPADNGAVVGAVNLEDGTKLPADLVILGVGVKPATDYLRDNPAIRLCDDGSVDTDAGFAVNGLEDNNNSSVFAIGDIATFPFDNHPTRIEHWNVAQNAGRTVAARISGIEEKQQAFTPVFWSALGQQLRYCGNTSGGGFDDVVLRGDLGPDKYSWVAYYARGQRVVAVATMGRDPLMAQAAELLRLDRMPTKAEVEGGLDLMEVKLGDK